MAKYVESSVEIINEPSNLKRIEIAGRTCYKSEDKITEGSAQKFFQSMVKNGHTSVLEHSNIIFSTWEPDAYLSLIEILTEYTERTGLPHYIRYSANYTIPYDANILNYPYVDKDGRGICFYNSYVFSGNVRAWRNVCSQFFGELILKQMFSQDPMFSDIFKGTLDDNKFHIRREEPREEYGDMHNIITARIVCDRAIMAEITRHRCMSFSVESTRYINYANRGDGECTFIVPEQFTGSYSYDDKDESADYYFHKSCEVSEFHYIRLIKRFRYTPQHARGALNMWTKTEMVVTGTVQMWKDFLRLRDSAAAHPEIQRIARMLKEKAGL